MGGSRLTPELLHAAVRDPAHDPVPLLLHALDAPEDDTRREAVHYLQEMPTSRAVAPLCRLLAADPWDDIRFAAADALGVIGDPAAVPALLTAVTDPAPAVRLCVADALGTVGRGDPRVAPALCCLLIDADSGVRRFALEALGDLGDPIAAAPVWTRLAGERRTPEVRVWVYYALDRLGEQPFPLTEAIALLRRSRRTEVRISAACALVRIASPQTMGRIRRALQAAVDRETGDGMKDAMRRYLEDLDEAIPVPST